MNRQYNSHVIVVITWSGKVIHSILSILIDLRQLQNWLSSEYDFVPITSITNQLTLQKTGSKHTVIQEKLKEKCNNGGKLGIMVIYVRVMP